MWRGAVTCRAQVYQWRAALREGRLAEPSAGVVGFVEIGAPANPDAPQPSEPGQPVEITLAGARSLKVWSSVNRHRMLTPD